MVLRLRYPAPNSWRDAKCRDLPVSREYDPFFQDDSSDAEDFCNGEFDNTPCPIRHECLLFALTNNEKHGVWGGSNEITRKAIRKRWPLKGREPRPEWQWLSEEEALDGLDLRELKAELEEEKSQQDD